MEDNIEKQMRSDMQDKGDVNDREDMIHCKKCGNMFEYDELVDYLCEDCRYEIIANMTFEKGLEYIKIRKELLNYWEWAFTKEEKENIIETVLKQINMYDKMNYRTCEEDSIRDIIKENMWEQDYIAEMGGK